MTLSQKRKKNYKRRFNRIVEQHLLGNVFQSKVTTGGIGISFMPNHRLPIPMKSSSLFINSLDGTIRG